VQVEPVHIERARSDHALASRVLTLCDSGGSRAATLRSVVHPLPVPWCDVTDIWRLSKAMAE